MKTRLIIAILSVLPAALTAKPVFHDYFSGYRLRVDCVHYGNANTEGYALDKVVAEPRWGGNPDNLIDPLDYGTYKMALYDHKSGKLIFSRGFASLFGEYKTTKQARKGLIKAFPESFMMPMPLRVADLVVLIRSKSGKFRRLWKVGIDPKNYRIVRRTPDSNVRVFRPWHTGDPAHRLDIMVVGDGYCKAQAGKFEADLRHFTNVFLDTPPFSGRKAQINVYGVLVLSRDCGVSEPRKGRYLRTAIGASFDSLGSARYLTTRADFAMRNAGSSVPYDIIYIMANTARYGGGGIYNLFSVFASDNEWDGYLMTHEFGHAFAGLADEYYSSKVAYEDFYPRGTEPWEPNISRRHRRRNLKWKSLATPDIPVPTPDIPKYDGAVGAFEGAGYVARGLYRPSRTCKMKDKGFLPFCAVCVSAIEKMIDYYTK